MDFLVAFGITFVASWIIVPLFLLMLRLFGVYAIVHERRCLVYVLFGKVVGVLDRPGLHMLWLALGPKALLVRWFGKVHELDMRLDQEYLRSQPVNSEEGAPMGIGIWYEMFVSDPVAYLFENADPRGSLRANVSNSTVRCLSNMELDDMLTTRHSMSREVRGEVSPMSHQWGYKLGSIYIRKVHFRDREMIHQIEEKVVNRLRQVTSAIRQDGVNRVSVITSTAEREAAKELARAAAMRPKIVGEALEKISRDPTVADALFEVLEIEKLTNSEAELTLIPPKTEVLDELIAAEPSGESGGGSGAGSGDERAYGG